MRATSLCVCVCIFHQAVKCNTSFATFTLIFPYRIQIMHLSEQLKTVDEFEDLKETIVRMRNETNLLLEDLQEGNDLHFGAWNASLMGKQKMYLICFWTEADKIHSAFH